MSKTLLSTGFLGQVPLVSALSASELNRLSAPRFTRSLRKACLVRPGGWGNHGRVHAGDPLRYILVGHARSRVERGLVGFLVVEGWANR